MPETKHDMLVNGKKYTLHLTMNDTQATARAFLGNTPAGPQFTLTFTREQVADFEKMVSERSQLLNAMTESLAAYVTDNLKM